MQFTAAEPANTFEERLIHFIFYSFCVMFPVCLEYDQKQVECHLQKLKAALIHILY